MANPTSRGQQRDKPFRDALRMEARAAESGQAVEELPPGSLRRIARNLLLRACDATDSAKEVADRLDGKVPQAVVGDDEHPPVTGDVSDLDAGRAVAFLLRKAMNAKDDNDGG